MGFTNLTSVGGSDNASCAMRTIIDGIQDAIRSHLKSTSNEYNSPPGLDVGNILEEFGASPFIKRFDREFILEVREALATELQGCVDRKSENRWLDRYIYLIGMIDRIFLRPADATRQQLTERAHALIQAVPGEPPERNPEYCCVSAPPDNVTDGSGSACQLPKGHNGDHQCAGQTSGIRWSDGGEVVSIAEKDDLAATDAAGTQEFEQGRHAGWRDSLDSGGRPTHGPERSHRGCHYCGGPLDARDGVGQYECPWCIARFPELATTEARGETR